jgi:hypothetical protein
MVLLVDISSELVPEQVRSPLIVSLLSTLAGGDSMG